MAIVAHCGGRWKRAEGIPFKIAVSMALYAGLFFVLAFCGPYVLPAITLFSDAPLTDRQVAASQLLLLSDTVWVAIPVFFLGAILFSLLVTRRVADALERLGQSARAWASGKAGVKLGRGSRRYSRNRLALERPSMAR